MDAAASTSNGGNRQTGTLGSSEAELRRKLALSLDIPPPVPPKDPPRPGTSSSSRPGTATSAGSARPTLMATMSTSRSGTAGTRPGTASTVATEKLRPGTAVSVKSPPQPALPQAGKEKMVPESRPTTAKSSAKSVLSLGFASKVSMTPLRPVRIKGPLKDMARSISLKRSNATPTPLAPAVVPERGSEETTRPTTSSTRRFSRSTTMTGKTIKYGVGRHANVELSPQPSDDDNDPLNWPIWKKDLNFVSLAIMASLANAMKTAFIPVGANLAVQFGVSQVQIAALTAMPLMISSMTSLASLTLAKLWGKRPVYLASAALLFIGSIWNMRAPSFSQAMGARFFQGLAWGAFDTLLLGSIHDSYFEHERRWRLAAYDVLCVFTTWAPPIFGGVAARNSGRYTLHFEIINAFYIIAIPMLLLCAPETAYDRWFSGSSGLPLPTTALETKRRSLGRFEVSVPTAAGLKTYLSRMKPLSDFRGFRDSRTLLQAPRAFVAPTTLILAFLTLLPNGALWGLTHALSPLFSSRLDTAQVGSLLAGPLVLSVLAPTLLIVWRRCRTETDLTPRLLASLLGAGASLSFVGILAFGLETHATGNGNPTFPLLSLLLGFLAAGAYLLISIARPLIWRSARFTGSNLHVCLRHVADMDAGVRCWRGFFTGVFVLAFASAMERSASGGGFALVPGTEGIKAGSIAMAVCSMALAGAVGAVWWFMDERVRRLDGRVMGFVDLGMLKRSESFFDHT